MAPTSFEGFGLDPRVLVALEGLGFDTPTPVQAAAIPPLLAGRDVIGRARTGSGKTAAFGLPIIERVREPVKGKAGVRVLVLAPTRELAVQVTDAIRSFARGLPVRVVTIYGGSSYRPQFDALAQGVPVVVGTPGRLIDHLERGSLDLSATELVVVDEADEMLRMGFIDDVDRLLAATSSERQVALFSATMPAPIRRVADKYLSEPLLLQVETSSGPTTEHIQQRFIRVPEQAKLDVLCRVLQGEKRDAALVFVRTRKDAATLAAALAGKGIAADALHGDLAQPVREQVLRRLRAGQVDCVIATDVAARGIDVEHISHVINVDLPDHADGYAHRIGRTGRAGREGQAISFVTPRQVGGFHEMRRRIGARVAEMRPPSDAEIARSQRAGLWDDVRGIAEQPPHARALDWVDELVGSSDWSAHDIAAAALAMLAEQRGLDLTAGVEDPAPPWSPAGSGTERRPRPDRSGAEPMVELFLPVGQRHGVRPGDIVGALANELGVPGHAIGRITIAERKSFVAVIPEIAAGLLVQEPVLTIRGATAPISLARTGGGPPSASGATDERSEPKPAGKPRTPGKPKRKTGWATSGKRTAKRKVKVKGKGKAKGKAKGKPKPQPQPQG